MNKKVLRWNFVFQYGYVLTNIFNSIILLPLYLKNIPKDTLGVWLATGNILAWMTLADPGVGDVLQQKIAEIRGGNRPGELGQTLGSGFMASGIIFFISLAAGFVFYFLLDLIVNKQISHYSGLSWALIFTVIATALSLFSFSMSGINQGLHNSAQVAISSLLANILFLVVNVVLLVMGFGVISIALANLFRAFFINVYNIIVIRSWLKREGHGIRYDKAHFRRFIRIFSFTSLSRIIAGLSSSIDIVILARFIPPGLITVFEINRRPVKMAQSLVGRHSVALMPVVSHAKGRGDKPGIIELIVRQFKFYAYAALFLSLVFCLTYRDLISAWTGSEQYAGDTVAYLLAANFFFFLIGYFMSNMGYALGDIKRNSIVNIIKGVLVVLLVFVFGPRYEITGTLVSTLGVTLVTDFFYFSYRLYKLGYLPNSLLKDLAGRWMIVLPAGLLLTAGCRWLINSHFPPHAYFNRLLVGGFLFSICFIGMILLMDGRLLFKKNHMQKLVVLLRVKDGIFFLPDWLRCYEKLADEIVVLDNGSTDGTYEMLMAHPKVAAVEQTFDYHEGRDKIQLYALARSRNPDWCLWVDVDEIFEPGLTRADFDRLMSRSWVKKYGFRRFHFIDREYFAGSWYRLKYMSGHDRILWKESSTGYFEDRIIDSPNVKNIRGLRLNTHFRLLHLGYINKEIVDKKAALYRSIIPDKEGTFQKMYLSREKKIRWSDNRKSLRVWALNAGLDVLLLATMVPRGLRKVKHLLLSNR